ncbi:hypothetical protein E6H36_03735 [Candidatus Bathyarchaeota archaeon]|nr:MAG: hypothetical protein AUJ07_01660 [Crenarchaeota archaeon 13_1_40CM_3_53_5]TMI26975.1 MAG: hypothetical protein E6H36_03735 [Candidatus Bathyarchaeota archaeon]
MTKMTLFRRFKRARKGMSTIFGGLFFIILILMGFNLMLWNFIQYDAYNQVITSTSLRDQQAKSENLVFNPPGARDFTANKFNITMNNQGGTTITVSRIYITNLSPTNSPQCQGAALCTVDLPPASKTFSNANIQTGENDHRITVNGMRIDDGSGYKVVVSTARGRQFSFYYPWPVNGPGASNSNQTNTAHGALDVKFDLTSFNFTRGTQTVSQQAWTVPYQTNVVYWVKVVNNAIYPVSISRYTSLYFVCYQDRFGSGQDPGYGLPPCNETDNSFVVDNGTMNPNTLVAYDDVNRPYVIPGAGPNGPSGFTIVKFGSFCPGSLCGNPPPPQDVDFPTPYLVFMGFFYKGANGILVGQTISFVAVRACSTYPSCP